VLAALLTMPAPLNASEARSVRFQHVSRDEGLSQSFVYAIVQDSQGFMWFGTQDGLNRFDGFEFAVYDHDPADPSSISDETIRTMIKTRSGTLWVGTDEGGVSRYEPATDSFTNFLHDENDATSIADNRVRVIYEDSAGVLWVGTDGTGLDRFDHETESFIHYRHDAEDPASLSSDTIWSILEDSTGALWVATDNGLNKLNPDKITFTRYRHDPNDATSLSDNKLRVLYEDNDNDLWVGTENGGLNRFDRDSEAFVHFRHDPENSSTLAADQINVMHQDDAGVLWVGTLNGLSAWNSASRSFETYANNPSDRYSLVHNNVSAIYQDRSGILWVGTYNGLSWWNQSTRAMLHFRNNASNDGSLNENTVMGFAENADGDIWVATYGGGLNLLDRSTGKFRHIRHDADDDTSLSSDQTMSLHVDRTGALWAGTRKSGLNRYDQATDSFTRFRHNPQDPNSLSADGVTYILEDSSDRVWVATFGGGLNRFDRETQQFTRFRHDPDDPNSLSNDRALLIFEDSAADLWIGTYGGGLNRLDPDSGEFTHYRADPDKPDGLPGDEIYMIEEQSNGDFWIGVKGVGLARWRREDRELGRASFELFTLSDGLPNTTIYGAVWDQQVYLWLSTGRGLSRLNTNTLEFDNFDTSHGLQGDEFNLSASYRAADGQIFFGGVNGFNAFYPNLIAGNQVPPQVAITSFQCLNDRIDLSEHLSNGADIEIEHTQDVISFEYAALDFAAPRKNRYMYKLDGLDADWVDAQTKRQVTYTNLPSGHYEFRVKAANNDGIWSEQDATMEFYVLPAPWRTWWAYTLYVALFAALAAIAFREQSRRTRQAEKLRFAEDFAVVQARLTEAQRIASIGNWEWDVVNDELWWSDEIYRLFGVDRQHFKATFDAFLERVYPDDLEHVNKAVQRALEGKEDYSIDHRIVLPDGQVRFVHERAEVTFDEAGRAIRMAGTVHDITDRKKAEDDIRRRADFQEMLAELSSHLMAARTSDIDEQMRQGLELVGTRCNLDAVSVWWFAKDNESTDSRYRWVRDQSQQRIAHVKRVEIPWLAERLLAGEAVAVDDTDKLPEDAAAEKKMLQKRGTKSFVIVPLRNEENVPGACVFSLFNESRAWTAEEITGYKLVAENVAGAILRANALAKIEKLQEKLEVENLYLQDEIRLAHGFSEIIGDDYGLKQCLMAVEKVAPTDVPVLILGETGTGKELIARAVHGLSSRRDRPLISVNCPTLPADIIESELFGHEKGAFTGAHSQRRGRFELADKGTLFLDEIGELPIELQSKLLRVLQSGEFVRLGGTETLYSDVRVIAATNRNLQIDMAKGAFRSDLFYRINNFPIRLPPLRHRKGDIPLLAEHFVRKHADRLGKKIEAISAKMIKELTEYPWPGNVRELESVIERAMISSTDESVLELAVPLQKVSKPPVDPFASDSDLSPSGNRRVDLSTAERIHILNVLKETNWRISGDDGAAAILGLPPSTLRSKMKRLGIQR